MNTSPPTFATTVIRTTSTYFLALYVSLACLRYVGWMQLRPIDDKKQGFIFELTDLYEKKNIPKVIYCIHALRYASCLLYAGLGTHTHGSS
jgi:hypothetical protein